MWIQRMPDLLKLETGKNLHEADSLIRYSAQHITIEVQDSIPNRQNNLLKNADSDSKSDLNRQSTSQIGTSFNYLLNSFLISLLVLALYSMPYKRYFRKRRKEIPQSEALERHCRKFLLKTPIIHSILFALPLLISLSYTAWALYSGSLNNHLKFRILQNYFFVSLLSSFLTILFVYYWTKHRVHLFYLEVLYTDIELRKRIFKNSVGKIRNRLWISSGMTTLLPLSIVIFYIVLSITSFKD